MSWKVEKAHIASSLLGSRRVARLERAVLPQNLVSGEVKEEYSALFRRRPGWSRLAFGKRRLARLDLDAPSSVYPFYMPLSVGLPLDSIHAICLRETSNVLRAAHSSCCLIGQWIMTRHNGKQIETQRSFAKNEL